MPTHSRIACVDCGGECHLLSHEPDDGFAAGDVVAYRCVDCLDRWDIVLTEDDLISRPRLRGHQRPPGGRGRPR